ncbi:hypothetical protein CRM22_008177 [Opisthorchis felineus]|nr:hypothetical protein CRM22_008177 [Opisthorchis felineus]
MEEYKKKHHLLKLKHEATVERYTTSIAALKLAAEEVARNVASFNRTVNIFPSNDTNAAHQRRSDAARFVKFHEIYLRRLDAVEQNLRVKNSNIRKSCKKVRFYARQHEYIEMPKGEIDFEYTALCCEEAYSTLMDKNDELVKLKVFANKVGRELRRCRTDLSNEMENSVKLENDMNHTIALIKLIRNEVETHIKYVKDETFNRTHIKAILAKYKVPSTSEYIKNLEEVAALVRDNAAVTRKKSLAELNLRRHKHLWSQVKLGKDSISTRLSICSKPRLSHNSRKEASHLARLQ